MVTVPHKEEEDVVFKHVDVLSHVPSPSLTSSSKSEDMDELPLPAPFFGGYQSVFTPPHTPPAITASMTFSDLSHHGKVIADMLKLRVWNPPTVGGDDTDSDSDLDFPKSESDSDVDLDFP